MFRGVADRIARCSVASLAIALVACRPPPSAEPRHEPAPAVAATPGSAEPEGARVVARVDATSIHAADIDASLRLRSKSLDDPQARAEALLELVERQLVLAEAERIDVTVNDDDIERGLAVIADDTGLTPAQLRREVAKTGVTFEGYRAEIAAQLVEAKLLARRGLLTASAEQTATLRARLLGCLRANAKIEVHDAALTLPDNPFAARAEIAAFAFAFIGKPSIAEAELQALAQRTAHEAAAADVLLCDALDRVELALREQYLERGLLDARVRIPWPAAVDPPLTITVEIDAGLPFVIGSIAFELSNVPAAKRFDTEALRRRVDALLRRGEPASMSRMRAATAEVDRAFREAGLGGAELEITRAPTKQRIRIDIVYRATA